MTTDNDWVIATRAATRKVELEVQRRHTEVEMEAIADRTWRAPFVTPTPVSEIANQMDIQPVVVLDQKRKACFDSKHRPVFHLEPNLEQCISEIQIDE